MEAVIQHFQENLTAYIAFTVCMLPVLYISRKYSGPVIFHVAEMALYAVVFHMSFAGLVSFFSWFRDSSSFKNYDTSGALITDTFAVPVKEFWLKELYAPTGLYYFELAVLAVIAFVVVYYRPLGFGQKNHYKGADGGQGSKASQGKYGRPRYDQDGNAVRPPRPARR